MLCCSQRLRPLAAASCGLRADTQHICFGIDGELRGSQQQQLMRLAVLGEWL